MATNRRNEHGLKNTGETYRTINGVEYIAWYVYVTPERVALMREKGIRCRRFGEVLYIDHRDEDQARDVDKSFPYEWY